MLFVVADHNDYIKYIFGDVFRPLTIHVVGFFVLSFHSSFVAKGAFFKFAIDRFVRYLWPFVIFYSLYAVGSVFVLSNKDISIESYLIGFLTGSFVTTKNGCGGAFMWFLPALFGFVCVSRIVAMLKPSIFIFLIIACFIFHAMATNLSEMWRSHTPFGLLISLYLLPVVVTFYLLLQSSLLARLISSKLGLLLVFLISVGSYSQLIISKEFVEVGLLEGPFYETPNLLMFNFIHIITALVFVWAIGKKISSRSHFLELVGEHSLIVYLLHPVLFMLFSQIIKYSGLLNSVGSLTFVLVTIASYIFSIGSAVFFGLMILKFPIIKSFLFPTSMSELLLFLKSGWVFKRNRY